jgi:hypothetical protein
VPIAHVPSASVATTNGQPAAPWTPPPLSKAHKSPPHHQRMTMEDYQKKYPVLSDPERRVVFIKLLEMKFRPEIVAMGLEVFPANQPGQMVEFVANFHKLVEMGFSPERAKSALLLQQDGDLHKAIAHVHEMDRLLEAGHTESEIVNAFLLFDNDIHKAAAFLSAHKALSQFGFEDLHIREALLLCGNSQEKAAQYLMNM